MPPNPNDSRYASSTLEEFKSQVMAATDIVQLIGRTVALKKRGRDFLGLCPFHTEKTPSFHVNPTRQFYYCFGCKAAGDSINFVKQRDRTEFMEALQSLAKDAGIAVPQFGRGGREESTDSQIILEANSATTMFFEKQLQDVLRGKSAREYLETRGITDESVKRFRIGLAVDAWEALLKGQVGQKFPADKLQLAGLIKPRDSEKGGGHYDTFRNRLMFPIRDPNGRVIAFGGRVMPGSQDPAKYLNSPETPLFSKSRCVYGLDLARQRIVETQTAVVVEGYTDVVMAHQFGATNVVSILGTAMTEQHVNLLRRFAQRIVLLFDADIAGDTAVDRAVSLFLTQPVEIAIATLGEDLDPDEYLLKYGLATFEKLIADAPEALAFKWKQLVRQFNAGGNNLTGQTKAVETYLDLIAQSRLAGPVDSIRWGLTVSKIGKLTGIPTDQLHHRLTRTPAAAKKVFGQSATPGDGELGQPKPEPRRKPSVLSARDRAERWILGVLLLEPARWHSVQAVLSPEDFQETCRRRLAEVYWLHQRDEGEPVFSEFLGGLTDDAARSETSSMDLSGSDLRELAIEVTQEVEDLAARDSDPEATLKSSIEFLHRMRQTQEKQQMVATLRRGGEENLDAEQEIDLLHKLQSRVREDETRRASGNGPP